MREAEGGQLPQDSQDVQTVQLVAIAVLAVVWLGLMTWGLGRRSLHVDEFLTAYRAEGRAQIADFMHPATYYRYVAFWANAVGSGDAALRSSSLLPAAVAVVCAGVIASWLLPWPAWLVAVALVCLSPQLLLYWRMARYFAPAAAAFGLVAVGTVGFRRERTWSWLVLAVAGSVAAAYSDYLAACGCIIAWVWLAVAEARDKDQGRLASVVLAGAAAATLSVPAALWALRGAGQVMHRGGGYPAKMYFLGLAVAGWSLLVSECLPPWQPLLAACSAIGMGILLSVGLREAIRRGGAWRFVSLAWATAVAIAAVAVFFTRGEPPVRISSLALYALPLALVTAALGWEKLWPTWVGKAATGLVAMGYLAGLHNYFAMHNLLNPQHGFDWRVVAEEIAEQAAPQDCIVTVFDAGFFRYYKGPGRPVELNEQNRSFAPVLRAVTDGGRAWIVTRDRGSLAARKMVARLLEALRRTGARIIEHYFFRYSPAERKWRSSVGQQSQPGYVTVYEAWLRRSNK